MIGEGVSEIHSKHLLPSHPHPRVASSVTRSPKMQRLEIFLVAVALTIAYTGAKRTFGIDYERNTFVKDGQPFRYVSGSMHYFRVPYQFWGDRMTKMRAAGLNALETYVEWNSHEPEPGQFNFSGDLDLVKFLQTANDTGLVVILRIGPYIDAERDMGGLPYWLLREKKDMLLRSSDAVYMKYVDLWLEKLLPLIKPALYSNGGPIIMAQVENEYGSYKACDLNYTAHLRDMYVNLLGPDVLLFTTDGASEGLLKCGAVDQVYATVDFGSGTNVSAAFATERTRAPKGPLVNSEYYPGWLDHWGTPHSVVSTEAVVKTLDEMLAVNASVNIYVFHGGTSFGFTSGSNGGDFQACPTSYDYDAPLSEAGDPTEKYFAIRETVGKYLPLPPIPLPSPAPKMKLPPIQLHAAASLLHHLRRRGVGVPSQYPLTFEELKQAHGFVLYQTQLNFQPSSPVSLKIPGIRDRGYVFVNEKLQGILTREQKITSLPILALKGQLISILVENQGRICFGSDINDFKGILGNVSLGNRVLSNWTNVPVKVDEAVAEMTSAHAHNHVTKEEATVPAYFTGTFVLPEDTELYDSFLRLDGWYKGIAIINGHNLGRYWPIVGPQQTLYVPSVYLKKHPDVNEIVILELENAPCDPVEKCTVQLTDVHVIDGPTPIKTNTFKKY